MSRDPLRAATQFFGGRVCLDFANTLDWRTSGDPVELIPDYRAFLAWSARRRTMPARALSNLASLADRDRVGASSTMAEALALRSELWKIADALREGRRADLKMVNALLADAPPQPPLLESKGAHAHRFMGESFCEPLWPVLWSLTHLLTSADARRIGCCQAEGCGWFYVDESPNRTRLWCSSEVCGNRERARRAYAKRSKKQG